MRILLLTAIIAVPIYACRSAPPSVDPPPPAIGQDIDTLPQLPPSVLNVPVLFDLAPVIRDLEEAIPATFGNLEEKLPVPSNDRLHVAYEVERDPFRARLIGDTAYITTQIRYSGKAWYNPPVAPELSASCGTDEEKPKPRASVAIAARISITPQWTLESDTRLVRLAPASSSPRDECRITLLRLDVTDKVMEAARNLMSQKAPAVDSAVAKLDLRGRFEEWWNVLRSPIELSDSVWLMINPLAVRREFTRGEGTMLVASVGLTASPRIIVGPRPPASTRSLPPLDSGAVGDGLHILAQAMIDYDVASNFLSRQLRGKKVDVAGHSLRILGIRVFGIGDDRLAVEVNFDGSARGHVFFVGTPHVDPNDGGITVPDLDFDVNTADLLVRGIAWIAHAQVINFLRSHIRIPVRDAMTDVRGYLHDGLNYRIASDARLRGAVDSIRPIGVHPTLQALVLQAHARAHARLEVGSDSVRLARDTALAPMRRKTPNRRAISEPMQGTRRK